MSEFNIRCSKRSRSRVQVRPSSTLLLPILLLLLLHPPSAQAISADVPEYWWEQKYKALRKIGEGYRGQVFRAARRNDSFPCVIKTYKPVEHGWMESVQREVDAMKLLQGGPNIVKLVEVLQQDSRAEGGGETVLVFELAVGVDLKDLVPRLTDADIRLYFYQLLQAIAFAHSRHILHLDMNPTNILIDHEKRQLMLIDWGRGRLFTPGGRLVDAAPAATEYAPPEMLLGMGVDFSVDLWAVGQMLGGFVYHRNMEPLLSYRTVERTRSDDRDCKKSSKDRRILHFHEQLRLIGKFLGTEELYAFQRERYLNLGLVNPDLKDFIGSHKGRGIDRFRDDHNEATASNEVADLIARLLRTDPRERISAEEALGHPYFDPVRPVRQRA